MAQREAYLVEFDCPRLFSGGRGPYSITKRVREVGGRRIQDARFPVEKRTFSLCSPMVLCMWSRGVINLGWQWAMYTWRK